MLLAAALFFAAGVLDGVYPGGERWIGAGGTVFLTYVFGLVNLVVAISIWRA